MQTKLLASAPSLDHIAKLIAEYYYGEKQLVPAVDGSFSVVGKSGPIDGVRVVQLRGRFRFERIAAA